MFSRPIQLCVVCLTMLCGCIPLFAQSPGYHLELSDGTSGRVIFVNDSKKPVEAFFFTAHCGPHIGGGGNYDALNSSGAMIGYAGVDGKPISQSVIVEPADQMLSVILSPQPSPCDWEFDTDAAFYADGTYEGNKESARCLQAKRDGIVASVRYWAERFNRARPTKEDLEAILTDANQQPQNGLFNAGVGGHRDDPQFLQLLLAQEYWLGRSQVDSTVAVNLKGWINKYGPEITYKQLEQLIQPWQKKSITMLP